MAKALKDEKLKHEWLRPFMEHENAAASQRDEMIGAKPFHFRYDPELLVAVGFDVQ